MRFRWFRPWPRACRPRSNLFEQRDLSNAMKTRTRHTHSLAQRLVALLLALVLPAAHAQNFDFETLLGGQDYPFTLKPSALDSSWRRVNLGSPTADLTRMMLTRGANVVPDIAYTRGQTVQTGKEIYLVIYRVQTPRDPAIRRRWWVRDRAGKDVGDNAVGGKIPFDAVLGLSLVNLKTMGDLNDIRAFNPKTDVETMRDSETNDNEESVSNLKQVGLALLQYTQDYDEKLPPMRSATSVRQITTNRDPRRATVQEVLQPYARSVEIFRHPRTRELYRPNAWLSRKSLAQIENLEQDLTATVAFYEASPWRDRKRAVLFLDGYVRRVREEEWISLKRASHIPP